MSHDLYHMTNTLHWKPLPGHSTKYCIKGLTALFWVTVQPMKLHYSFYCRIVPLASRISIPIAKQTCFYFKHNYPIFLMIFLSWTHEIVTIKLVEGFHQLNSSTLSSKLFLCHQSRNFDICHYSYYISFKTINWIFKLNTTIWRLQKCLYSIRALAKKVWNVVQ